MIIDIRKTVLRKKVRGFFTTIFFLVIIALLLATELFSYEILGATRYQIAIVIAAIYIIIVVYNTLRNFFYIFYNDEGEKLILRFFSMSYLARKKSSIEFKKNEIAGFKIEKNLFGLHENLIIYQKTKNGQAKYPPVSLTALTKEEKKKLISSLSHFGKRFQ